MYIHMFAIDMRMYTLSNGSLVKLACRNPETLACNGKATDDETRGMTLLKVSRHSQRVRYTSLFLV